MSLLETKSARFLQALFLGVVFTVTASILLAGQNCDNACQGGIRDQVRSSASITRPESGSGAVAGNDEEVVEFDEYLATSMYVLNRYNAQSFCAGSFIGRIDVAGNRVGSGAVTDYPHVVLTAAHVFYSITTRSDNSCSCSLRSGLSSILDAEYRQWEADGITGESRRILDYFPKDYLCHVPNAVVYSAKNGGCFLNPQYEQIALTIDAYTSNGFTSIWPISVDRGQFEFDRINRDNSYLVAGFPGTQDDAYASISSCAPSNNSSIDGVLGAMGQDGPVLVRSNRSDSAQCDSAQGMSGGPVYQCNFVTGEIALRGIHWGQVGGSPSYLKMSTELDGLIEKAATSPRITTNRPEGVSPVPEGYKYKAPMYTP